MGHSIGLFSPQGYLRERRSLSSLYVFCGLGLGHCGECSGSVGSLLHPAWPVYNHRESLAHIGSSKSDSIPVSQDCPLSPARLIVFTGLFDYIKQQPPALTGVLCSWVWSTWDEKEHLQVWDHGSQAETTCWPKWRSGRESELLLLHIKATRWGGLGIWLRCLWGSSYERCFRRVRAGGKPG